MHEQSGLPVSYLLCLPLLQQIWLLAQRCIGDGQPVWDITLFPHAPAPRGETLGAFKVAEVKTRGVHDDAGTGGKADRSAQAFAAKKHWGPRAVLALVDTINA
ncbi:hypothetical protein B0H10DRAFT_1942753 [Mycena sp. CBHHK59/15]|nr:hypothetical protein B0H10DRAFT_1942753 [Mycena sp. CBHHK59/15]